MKIPDYAPLVVVGTVAAALTALAIWMSIQEEKQWRAWSQAHDCRVIEKRAGSSSVTTGLTGDGKMVTATSSTPAQTAYLCDDGATYWRNEP